MPPQRLDAKVPLLTWATILEDKARDQSIEACSMPFVWPHGAGMPDMHWGLGCAVGLVYPTVGAIVPACVGVDIGCGMIAACTELSWPEVQHLDFSKLRELIQFTIPMSKGNYNSGDFDSYTTKRVDSLAEMPGAGDASQISPDWAKQLGSLGGGNHFIEFCRDREDRVWIFLHSGSRGVGNRLAQKYIKLARELCAKWWINLPNPDLAYLVQDTPEFWDYMRCLRWAQHFAQLNREEMLHRCRFALCNWYGQDIELSEIIRCHHNYTEEMPSSLRSHFRGDERIKDGRVWLTRKGAIDASAGKLGLIPGSMGARSYIVTGLGNHLSLRSAPHGAGRMFGRRQAASTFTAESLKQAMRNIEWTNEIAEKLIDEHPLAYKKIDTVMADARSLVTIRNELRQFINIKGELCQP